MRSDEIQSRFLRYFTSRGHTLVPSADLPSDDPTLLFVNAGMVPFKQYFTGRRTPPFQRATSAQKCLRTIDIDEVGKTDRHVSFFQMLGNFSFGDYFKETAIPLAWELLTAPVEAGGFGLPEDRLWPTVHVDDDEARDIWHQSIGVPLDRIQRRTDDNMWSMGVPGPCGPCSEIFYDRGPKYGPEGGPIVDENRYMEIWNLVFMQYERGEGTEKNFAIVGELPAKNIDTGMGLERMATVLQDLDNIYEIDTARPILDAAAELTGHRYGEDPTADVSLRVITDHLRSATMAISDGATPSNEGRGYVLRRLLRRAVRNLRLLGYDEPALPILLPVVRDVLSPSFPELATDWERVSTYAYAEEEAFAHTLRQGTTIFEQAVTRVRESGHRELPGDQAFTLHDTYGFPIDLTLEMAREQGLSVDEDGFRRLMDQQRRRAKEDARSREVGQTDTSAYRRLLDEHGANEFTGYRELVRESTVTGVLGATGTLTGAGEGDEVDLVLDATPFYAEAGGQQPDAGVIATDTGLLEVLDVQSPIPGVVAHRVRVLRGEVRPGQTVHARVDVDRRRSISRAHTATHLIHRAIRGALGESATQAGSLNAPGRLRFDFATPRAVPASVLGDVEDEVNAILMDDLEVRAFITSLDEARKIGAMALFGEKYGDRVRVVEVGDYARELCGGTHAARSGQLGLVKLLDEASIGSGVRRVEALVGLDAFRFLAREHILAERLAETFKAPFEEVPDRVEGVLSRLRAAEKELERLRADAVLASAATLATGARDVAGVALVLAEVPGELSGNELRALAVDVRGRFAPNRPGVVALFAPGPKVSFVVATTEAARDRGLSANAMVRAFAPAVDGRGGGKDDIAQGGGSNPGGVPEALVLAERYVTSTS